VALPEAFWSCYSGKREVLSSPLTPADEPVGLPLENAKIWGQQNQNTFCRNAQSHRRTLAL
jgi:hypothetical protein